MNEVNETDSDQSAAQKPVIDGWMLDEESCRLELQDESVRLEPKTTRLLVYLARYAGQTLSRERLLQQVWPDVIVSDEALSNAVNKIRKAFKDDRQNPRIIETIPKKGYRLIAPVEWITSGISEIRGDVQQDRALVKDAEDARKSSIGRWAILVFVLVIVILAGMLLMLNTPRIQQGLTESTPTTATDGESIQTENIPSILVLPFRNIGNRVEDEYFTDGMTDDVITDMSRLSNILVISGHTAVRFKDRNISALDAGRELDCDYILDGSMRRAGSDLRVNVQLIDVETGAPLWAERYDRHLDKIFEVQDEITSRIVKALSIRLTTAEQKALEAVSRVHFDAYDVFLKGQRNYNLRERESVADAISAYKKAIRIDPSFARAYGAYGVALALQYRMGWTDTPNETLDRALEMAQKAVSIDDAIPQVHWALSYVRMRRKEFDKAIEAAERAIRIAPNYADAHAILAVINNVQGRADQAISNVRKAMQINPYYPYEYPYNLGRAHYLKGQYEKARDYLQEALARNGSAFAPRLYLIASYMRQSLLDDAQWEVEQLLTEFPGMTISRIRQIHPDKKDLLESLLDELRKAGLPE